eukprot:scpid61261/ scgid17944/ Adenosine monophosphate-protein transferase FICD homolog
MAASPCVWFITALLPFVGYLIAVFLHAPKQFDGVRQITTRYLNSVAEKRSEPKSSDVASVSDRMSPFLMMPEAVGDWKFHSRRKEAPPDPFPVAMETEAQVALRQAKSMYESGRTEKAQRLFQRALQFSPRSADALSAYGEFLHREKEPLEAEKLLAKALQVRPDHPDARRILNMNSAVVEDIDRALFVAVDAKRNSLLKVPHDDPAFIRAVRENYVRHVYHSNAIEGNTLTLSMVRSILETGLAVAGKSIREHNDVLGLDLALTFVHQSTLKRLELTVEDVIELHQRIMGHSQPLDAGKFRDTQVFVSKHVPPSPRHLPDLMDKFGQWLVSAEAAAMHPIARAAMDHFKLVHIHPFVDGNGRLSRLLMNIRLMQGGYPPIIVPVQERYTYYEMLSLADGGDPRPFIRYVANLTDRTLEEYLLFTQKQIVETAVPVVDAEPVAADPTATAQSAEEPDADVHDQIHHKFHP